MKTSKILIVLVAMLSLMNTSSWAQETIITTPGEYVVPYDGNFPRQSVTKIVVEKVAPSQVKIGFGWTTNFWSTPVGHPEDNSYANFVSASLPGPYDNTGSDGVQGTKVSYISWPEIWVNGVKMGNITHNGAQFSYAEGITQEIFHVEQSGEYVELRPQNASDIVELRCNPYFTTYNGSKGGVNWLYAQYIAGEKVAGMQSSYILNVPYEEYLFITGDSYGASPRNDVYFSIRKPDYVPVAGISLPESITQCGNGEVSLQCEFFPANATYRDLIWTYHYAGMNDWQLITERGGASKDFWVNMGESTVIKVSSVDGQFVDSCLVTITPYIDWQSVTLDKHSATLHVGDKLTLHAIVSPSDVCNSELNWYSTGPHIASVDENGVVTAHDWMNGNAYIYVSERPVAMGISDYCVITVLDGVNDIPEVSAQPSITIIDEQIIINNVLPIKRVAIHAVSGNKVIERVGDIREIEVSSLHSGMYIVRVILENGKTLSQKIVKD
ncbi:hypothetical protein AGMMS50262_01540 [Bacteroidia bacterium]|nr:hypothetical protein AGMMS50262_01540 [Bacteroidia bacterium]